MVKTRPKAKVTTFSATPRDLEMLEVVARYHGLNKSATIVSLVRKEFWRAFPGGRYPYLKGCWFSEQSWDGSAVFMERPHQGEVQTCGLYVSDRAAAALRSARITNVALERLTEREVSAMIFGEAARARWPEELRGRIAAERDPS